MIAPRTLLPAALAVVCVLSAAVSVTATATLHPSAAARRAAAQPMCWSSIVAGDVDVTGLPSSASQFVTYNADDVQVSGNQIKMRHGTRGYLGQCDSSFQPHTTTSIPLMGKTISAVVDLSSVSCACNVALYLVYMPAINSQGQADPTVSKDYYCDANEVSGIFCPEIDLFEANRDALQVTPHKCNNPDSQGYFSWCDRGGCAKNTYRQNPSAFGNGGQYTINTQNPFVINTTFVSYGDYTLNQMTTVLYQQGRTVTLTHDDSSCGGGYMEQLSNVVNNGMTLVFSSWGSSAGTMSWLDEPPCPSNVNCDIGADSAIISELSVS